MRNECVIALFALMAPFSRFLHSTCSVFTREREKGRNKVQGVNGVSNSVQSCVSQSLITQRSLSECTTLSLPTFANFSINRHQSREIIEIISRFKYHRDPCNLPVFCSINTHTHTIDSSASTVFV